MNYNWNIKKTDSSIVEYNSNFFKIHESIASILFAKGLKTPVDIDNFINPRFSALQSPFQMMGIYDAVKRIRRAVADKEKIGIFSDSDIDGLTSLKVLYNLIVKLGIKPFVRYLKDHETYGLTKEIVDEFKSNAVTLIVTVDSGIRDVEEIDYGNSIGLNFIITDHHEQDKNLPNAIIINPKQNNCSYRFKYLAGVGVAFKLSQAILQSYLPSFNMLFLLLYMNKKGEYFISYIKNCIVEKVEKYDTTGFKNKLNRINNEKENKISLVVCNQNYMGKIDFNDFDLNIFNIFEMSVSFLKDKKNELTIEKIADFFSININLYNNQIDLINTIFLEIQFYSSPKIVNFINSVLEFVALGSIADVVPLIDENRTLVFYGIKSINKTNHKGLLKIKNNGVISSKTIGWDIAPLLNSPGRFGETNLTADFFLENNSDKLDGIILRIKELNEHRKQLAQKIFLNLNEKIENGLIKSSGNVIFIMSEEIPEGLAGLIANKITDELNKPVIIAALPGKNGLVKGSGRSKGDFNFFDYVKPFSNMFDKIGGHAQAFGFTISKDRIVEVIEKINSLIGDNHEPDETIYIDYEIDVKDIDIEFINQLLIFEPFGKNNEEIIFLSKNVEIKEFLGFGNDNRHGRFIFTENQSIKVIGWNNAVEMNKIYKKKLPVNIIYRLEINKYLNKNYPQLILIDIKYGT